MSTAADYAAQVSGETTAAATAGLAVTAGGTALEDTYAQTYNPGLYAIAKSRLGTGGTQGKTAGPPWLLIAGVAGAGLLLWLVLKKKGAALSGYRRRRRAR